MRDKFIEILRKRSCFYNKSKCNARCSNCDYVTIDDNDIGKLADHFLANGAVVPLCKVGDTVYQVDTLFDEIIITELTVIEFTVDSKGMRTLYGMTNKGSVYCFNRGYNLNDIKFTKEEAERALKKVNKNQNNCVDCDECPHRSEDCLCDISNNDEDCPLLNLEGGASDE